MVEGLKVFVLGGEVAQLMLKRAAHHKERAAFYEDKAVALEDGGAEKADFTNGDPIRALRSKGTQHANEAACLEFEALHVDGEERYLLDRNDLERLGVAPDRSGWY